LGAKVSKFNELGIDDLKFENGRVFHNRSLIIIFSEFWQTIPIISYKKWD